VSVRSASIQPARLSTNFTSPEASAIHFNRQVEIRVRASGPARATTENVECDYFGRRSCPLAENISRKLLHDWLSSFRLQFSSDRPRLSKKGNCSKCSRGRGGRIQVAPDGWIKAALHAWVAPACRA
jgi:hypothetical protein